MCVPCYNALKSPHDRCEAWKWRQSIAKLIYNQEVRHSFSRDHFKLSLHFHFQLQAVFRDFTTQAVATSIPTIPFSLFFFFSSLFFTEKLPGPVMYLECKILCHSCSATNCGQIRGKVKNSRWTLGLRQQNLFLFCSKLPKSLAEYSLSTPVSFPKR